MAEDTNPVCIAVLRDPKYFRMLRSEFPRTNEVFIGHSRRCASQLKKWRVYIVEDSLSLIRAMYQANEVAIFSLMVVCDA